MVRRRENRQSGRWRNMKTVDARRRRPNVILALLYEKKILIAFSTPIIADLCRLILLSFFGADKTKNMKI